MFGSRAVRESQESVVGYSNRFQCIPDDVPYRTPVQTPKPTPAASRRRSSWARRARIHGHLWPGEGAVPLGPAGAPQRAQLVLDAREAGSEAGVAWGSMSIPRIGHGSSSSTLEGDPDRPLIVGRVYHGADVLPYNAAGRRRRRAPSSRTPRRAAAARTARVRRTRKGAEEIYLRAEGPGTSRSRAIKDPVRRPRRAH